MLKPVNQVLCEAPSLESLFLELRFGDKVLSSATGFVVSVGTVSLLITARHVMTGRHPDTGHPLSAHAGTPDRVNIYHNGANKDARGVDTVARVTEMLVDADQLPLWIEHPNLGADADIVALPLTMLSGVQLMPVDVSEPKNPISCRPSEMVSIVGYPFGKTGTASAGIWSTGFVASDVNTPWNGKPVFLVDIRTRTGQSGSPVFAYRIGACLRADGSITFSGPKSAAYNFLGVYAGRIHCDSDIGLAWNAATVRELISHAVSVLKA